MSGPAATEGTKTARDRIDEAFIAIGFIAGIAALLICLVLIWDSGDWGRRGRSLKVIASAFGGMISFAAAFFLFFGVGALIGGVIGWFSPKSRDEAPAARPPEPDDPGDRAASLDARGDALKAEGDLAGALGAYREALAIRTQLSARDPGDVERRRALVFSYDRIGTARRAQGDFAGALQAFRLELELSEKMASLHPGDAEWQYDVFIGLARVGSIAEARAEWPAAMSAYRKAKAGIDALLAKDPANTRWGNDRRWVEERLAQFEARSTGG